MINFLIYNDVKSASDGLNDFQLFTIILHLCRCPSTNYLNFKLIDGRLVIDRKLFSTPSYLKSVNFNRSFCQLIENLLSNNSN